ncbi:MAG: beta-ketoacyl synthase N-terminal-like domain-containing protein, partial [Elusimicrobiota bacterium]
MSERRVVVTGMGEITPVGKNVQENWNSLVNGKSGISIIKRFDVSNYSSQVGGEVDDFNPSEYGIGPKKARKIDLFVQFALAAAKEAYEQSGLDMDKESPSRCGAIIGSGIGGLNTIEREYKKMIKRGPKRVSPFLIPAMIIDMASGQVSIEYGLQ